MARITQLTSPENPRIKQAARLRRQRERRKTGLCLIEGPRELTRAAAAGFEVHTLFHCPALQKAEPASPAIETLIEQANPQQVFEVTEALMKKLTQLEAPPAVAAVIAMPTWAFASLPAVSTRSLYLVAVGIEKPGNLGAMLRTAEAAGCKAVFVADGVVDPFHPHAIRNATGAGFTLPTIATTRSELTDWCQAHDVRLAAATLREAVPHDAADLTGPLAIAIGPEDTGLDAAWHEAAEATAGPRLRIAMHGTTVDSLNAAAAAAVLLFEARRQRG